MIRYSIPHYKLFRFFFISLKREALICGNLLIMCVRFPVSLYPSVLIFDYFLLLRSARFSKPWLFVIRRFVSFSIETWWSFGWFNCLALKIELHLYFFFVWRIIQKPFRVLPVHWYHLFVSIYYHYKFLFSRRNIVRSNENVIVQNTDLRNTKTKPDWQCNRVLIW